jgi:hypothetical protein
MQNRLKLHAVMLDFVEVGNVLKKIFGLGLARRLFSEATHVVVDVAAQACLGRALAFSADCIADSKGSWSKRSLDGQFAVS